MKKYRYESSTSVKILCKIPYQWRVKIGHFLSYILRPKSSWMGNGPGVNPEFLAAGFFHYIPEYDYNAFVFPVGIVRAEQIWPDRF